MSSLRSLAKSVFVSFVLFYLGDRIVLESSPSDLADEHAVPRGAGAQATGPGR